MLSADVLKYLRCPDDGSELTVASESVVRQINANIRNGKLRNRSGRILHESLSGGLIRAKGDVLYPIVHGIPVLLRDEAIPLENSAAGQPT
jgi:uncharacterized protein YbaR (Trm112 family)